MKMKKVYVAHPYSGNDDNRIDVEKIILALTIKNPDILYISPIHALGYLYTAVSYDEGMRYCFALLEDCDELLICEQWENSTGCCLEHHFANSHDIPIKYHNIA